MNNKAMAKHVMPLFFQISPDLDSKNSGFQEFHSREGIMVSQIFFIKKSEIFNYLSIIQ